MPFYFFDIHFTITHPRTPECSKWSLASPNTCMHFYSTPCVPQRTESTIKLCLSLREVHCFHAFCNELLLCCVLCFHKLTFIKNKLSCFLCLLRLIRDFMTGTSHVMGQNMHFGLKNDPDVRDRSQLITNTENLLHVLHLSER